MQKEKRINPNEISLGQLHPKEVSLLYHLRNKYRFGDIIIQVRDGLPYRIKKVTEFETLD